ncbi:MAG: hypothetical protein ABJQ14_01530, partial [Hyphomicrobiales bacterium]
HAPSLGATRNKTQNLVYRFNAVFVFVCTPHAYAWKLEAEGWFMCVFFTWSRSFYLSTSVNSKTSVRADHFNLIKRYTTSVQALRSQYHDTAVEIPSFYSARRVDNVMPYRHRTGYDRHDIPYIRILACVEREKKRKKQRKKNRIYKQNKKSVVPLPEAGRRCGW